MPSLENRIVPTNREVYLSRIAESLRSLQEESAFTDVILYSGEGGEGIGIHKTVLKRLSSPLSGLLEDSSCCFCLGSKCQRGSETFGITLQGTKTRDVKALVRLLYTGKTSLSGPDEYRNIREVAELLQIRLPKSSLTLLKEKTLGEESEDEERSRKRKGDLSSSEDFPSCKLLNRGGGSSEEDIEIEVEDDTEDEDEEAAAAAVAEGTQAPGERREDPYLVTKNCPKCDEAFTNHIDYVRHVNGCSLKEGPPPVFLSENKMTSTPKTRHPCPGCGVLYPDSPWFRQHVKSCAAKANNSEDGFMDEEDGYVSCLKCDSIVPSTNILDHVCTPSPLLKLNNISIETSSPENTEGKKLCTKCNRYFFVMKGGYVRHIRACQGIMSSSHSSSMSQSVHPTSTINGIMAEDGKSKACPKCGKVYTPKNYRYFDPHVARCIGPLEPSAIIEPPPPTIGQVQTCSGCNKSFTLNHWYQKHLATCRKRGLDLHQRPGLTISETGSYGCHKCSHTYATRADLKRHLIQHYGDRVRDTYNSDLSDKCSMCAFVGQTADQMVTHLCLKHEKLKEVIPKDVARMLYIDTSTSNNSVIIHQQNPIPLSPQQQQQQLQQQPPPPQPPPSQQQHPLLAHQLPPGTSADIVNNCHVCRKVFSNRTTLRSHIFTHYLSELRKVYHDPGDPTACVLCTYRSSSIHHLMIHVGLKHKKLAEFLPPDIASYFFDESLRSFPRRPVQTQQPPIQPQQPKPVQPGPAPPPPPLKMMPQQPKTIIGNRYGSSAQKNWTCMFCYKELGNDKGNLKQHLLCHTRDKIRDHFMNPTNPRSCLFCDYNSNLPDHMVTHVGLTHQKIREFLPRDYGDILFRGPYTFELQPNNVAFCEHCTMEFTTVEELEKHLKRNGGNCVWTCQKCQLTFQGRKNVEKHQMYCQRKPSVFACEICGMEMEDLMSFKSHLCSHFKQELINVIGNDVNRCDDCGIDFDTDQNALLTHVGSEHDIIFNVLPANLLKKVKALMMETIFCFVCHKEFNSSTELASHDCNVPDDDAEDQDYDEFCRLCGDTAIVSYSQYKEHLYGHYMDKLNNDFRSDYDKDKKACERCEEPIDNCNSYIKHLSLDHDEILKYIDEDTMDHLKSILHKSNHLNSGIGDPMDHAGFEMDFVIKEESMSPLDMSYEVEEHDGIICDYSSRDAAVSNNFSANDDFNDDVTEEEEAGGNIPINDRNMPMNDGNMPMNDGNMPMNDGNMPMNDGNMPMNDGNMPMNDRDMPINDRDMPINDGDMPINDGNIPINDGNMPINDGNIPINDGNMPINDGNIPLNDGNNGETNSGPYEEGHDSLTTGKSNAI